MASSWHPNFIEETETGLTEGIDADDEVARLNDILAAMNASSVTIEDAIVRRERGDTEGAGEILARFSLSASANPGVTIRVSVPSPPGPLWLILGGFTSAPPDFSRLGNQGQTRSCAKAQEAYERSLECRERLCTGSETDWPSHRVYFLPKIMASSSPQWARTPAR